MDAYYVFRWYKGRCDPNWNYDNNKIQPNHRYNMRATIHVDGKLRFTTDTIKSVITDVENTQQADLRLVGVR